MPRKPGRPHKICRTIVIETLVRNKDSIILPNNKLRSKLEDIWGTLSANLGNAITAYSLYALACRNDVRKAIFGSKTPDNSTASLSMNDASLSEQLNESSVDEGLIFTITADKGEFTNLVERKMYSRRDGGNKKKSRCYTVLKCGQWQEWITNLIWKKTRLQCAFNFRNCNLNNDATKGSIKGKCKCGSTLRSEINAANTENVEIHCFVQRGLGVCGTRPLRAPMREVIGKRLCTESAAVYRAERADELMQPGDPRPPHLPKGSSLHNAKYEYISKQHLHKDPIRALEIMQLNTMANTIHTISLNPFRVVYWTNHQLHMYRTYSKNETACVYIDATGGIIKPVLRYDGSSSHCIYLYIVAIHYNGQFSVAQMISEKHDAQTIMSWLTEWEKFGAPTPKEVVCDSSRALLGAAIRAFTGYATINDYADACNGANMPATYVRIDVAHFIKMYAGVLKTAQRRVRIFYMAAIGQLILCRTRTDAAKIVKSILILAYGETDGTLPSGEVSICEIHKKYLTALFDPNAVNNEEERCDTDKLQAAQSDSVFHPEETNCRNQWSIWADEINEEAKRIANSEEGSRVNAHYLPDFASRLVNDLRWLPLWSNICRDQFGYGRIPASSASVESEFNYIKTHLLKNCQTPVRVDTFVQHHVKNLNGRLKIAAASELEADSCSELEDDSKSSTLETSIKNLNDRLKIAAASKVEPDLGSELADDSKSSTLETSIKNLNDRLKIAAASKVEPDLGSELEDDSKSSTLETSIKNLNDRLKIAAASKVEADLCSELEDDSKSSTLETSIKNLNDRLKIAAASKVEADLCSELEDDSKSSSLETSSEGLAETIVEINKLATKKNRKKARSVISPQQPTTIDLTNVTSQTVSLKSNKETCALCGVDLPQTPSTNLTKDQLCAECKHVESVSKIMLAREVENWGGLAVKGDQRRSRYLTRNYSTFDAISHERLSKIPIMRNASFTQLQAIKFGKEYYSFSNSCAFDSLMHGLLVGAHDKRHIKQMVTALANEVRLFGLILYIMTKGLTAHAYRLRASMLKELFQRHRELSTETNVYVNCEVNVTYLTTMIFAQIPSIEETSSCDKGCKPRQKKIRAPSIKMAHLKGKGFKDVLDNYVALKGPRACCKRNCDGTEVTTFSKSGPIVFLEIEDAEPLALEDIPQRFCDPIDANSVYELLFVVNFKGVKSVIRRSHEKKRVHENAPMGHYTAVCLRPPRTWMEFDDMAQKSKKLNSKHRVNPGLLIYAKRTTDESYYCLTLFLHTPAYFYHSYSPLQCHPQ